MATLAAPGMGEADNELVNMAPTAWALLSHWNSVWDAPRGQAHPPALNREGVTPLLKLAASSVVVLQQVLEGINLSSIPPFGASRELLVHAIDGSPLGASLSNPVQDPVGFVRALVLASFQTGDGEHPEPLSKEYLSNQLDQHCAKQLTLAGLLVADPQVALRAALNNVSAAIGALLAAPRQTSDLSSSAQCLQLSQRLERLVADATAITAEFTNRAEAVDTEMTDVEADAGETAEEESGAMTDPDDEERPLERTKSQVVRAIQVERVTKNLEERRDPIHELRRTASLMAGREVPSSQTPLQEALDTVVQAQKRARNFGEDLVEDMLALDKLSGLTPEDRATRKSAIAGIEALLEDVDSSKGRLATLERTLKGKLKEQEETAAAAKAAAEQAAAADAAEALRKKQEAVKVAIQNVLQADPPGAEFWKQVRLPLRFHSQERGDGYIIHATVPGLHTEDIKLQVSEDNENLTVAGLRVPNMQECQQMKKRMAVRLQELAKSKQFAAQSHSLDAQSMYAELGQDTYGKFSETFQIPEDADLNNLDAQYNDGVLSVFIPKIRRAGDMLGDTMFAPGRYHGGVPGTRSMGGGASYPGMRRTPTRGLFGGHDPAYFW